MSFRTRMAALVILFMLGCVLVAPYYRSGLSNSAGDAGSDTSLPTLQIQQPKTADSVEVTDVKSHIPVGQVAPTFPAVSSKRDVPRLAQVPKIGPPDAPFPGLKMPPPLESGKSELVPITVKGTGSTISGAARLKPVSLIGTDIGTDATWVTSGTPRRGRFSSTNATEPPRPSRFDSDPLSQSQDAAAGRQTGLQPDSQPGSQPGSRFATQQEMQRVPIASGPPSRHDASAFDRAPQADRRATGNRWDSAPASTVAMRATPGAGENRGDTASKGRYHRIINGDTLRDISVQYYGTPEFHQLLFEVNRRALNSPEILPIGRELAIPTESEIRAAHSQRRPAPRQQLTPVGNDWGPSPVRVPLRVSSQHSDAVQPAGPQARQQTGYQPFGTVEPPAPTSRAVDDGWRAAGPATGLFNPRND